MPSLGSVYSGGRRRVFVGAFASALLVASLLPAAALGAGTPVQLAITSVNGGASPVAGVAFDVVVESQTAGGAAADVTSSTVVALSRAAGTGTLSAPSATIPAGSSSVTISGVTYSKAESGVSIRASRTSGDSLTSGTSAAFTVVAAPAAKLDVVSVNNGTSPTVDVPFAVVVRAEDTFGNRANVTATTGVTLSRASGTGNLTGSSLVGSIPAGASEITISGISYSAAQSGVSIRATATSGDTLTAGTSASFTVLPEATKLAIISVNGGTSPTADLPFSVVVRAEDSGGATAGVLANTVVTLSVFTGSGTLSPSPVTGTIPAGSSSVTISGISYSKAETGVSLRATTAGNALAQGVSSTFTVLPKATKLAIVSVNGGTSPTAGVAFSVIVRAEDAAGATAGVLVDTGVTLAISTGTGTLSGNLTGTILAGDSSVTISGVLYSKAENVVLRASASGLTTGLSATFAVLAPATKLAITSINGGTSPTANLPFSVIVQSQNASGVAANVPTNTVVTLTLNTGTGSLSGTLAGTIPAGSSSVTISGVVYSKAESNVRLQATTTSGTTLTAAVSAAFSVLVTQHLVFTTQPGGGLPGVVWASQPVVKIENSQNQVVTTDSTTVVTISIASNPAGGTLSCTSGTSRTAINGVVSFYGCSINIASTSPYTLVATSSPAWTPATSNGFLIGAPTVVVFTTGAALGNTLIGPFSKTTKIQKAGFYITWRFDGGLAAAGQTVQIWVYKKFSLYGKWTGPIMLTTRRANASGVAFANIRTGGILWLSIRPVLGAVWGPTSIGRWIR